MQTPSSETYLARAASARKESFTMLGAGSVLTAHTVLHPFIHDHIPSLTTALIASAILIGSLIRRSAEQENLQLAFETQRIEQRELFLPANERMRSGPMDV